MRVNGISKDAALKHEKEMKRYLAIRAIYPNSRFPMAGGPVDELWHTFLLFTKEYASFCNEVAGSFIDHNPGPANPSESEINLAKRDFEDFIEKYASVFGGQPPSGLWPRIGSAGVLWSC